MSSLYDSLQRFAEQVRKRLPNVKGEEGTKTALILPFLSVLGYDPHDPTEVQPEYVADFAANAKKRGGGPAEKVDYAIHLEGSPKIFIEAKAAGVDLVSHSAQLARYFNSTPSCPLAILTNGSRYLFYTDLEEKNILGEKPFFEFDALRFTLSDAEILEVFTRARFKPETVREQAEDIIYTSKISGYINTTLRNPSDGFTRFVLGEVGVGEGRRVTARLIEKFTPMIKGAIQATLLDMATRSIKEQSEIRSEEAAAPAAVPSPAPVKAVASSEASGKGAEANAKIVTTEDELEGLKLVREICAGSPLHEKAPVLFRDTANWFTISTITIRRWFVRLCFNQKKRSIVTPLSGEQTKALCQGFEVDGSRVFLGAVKDISRLRPLILHAYEEAVRQKEPAATDDAS